MTLAAFHLVMAASAAGDDDGNCNSSRLALSELGCPSCGHRFTCQQRGSFADQRSISPLRGLPAGVRFDPTDTELLHHLESKVNAGGGRSHPLLDVFIPTLVWENGICCTHPDRLPGTSRDGEVRHFFHRPANAYTTGNRKRRRVDSDDGGGETRWHKTGKTRPITIDGEVRGQKKILVLYRNYGKKRKPEKTNWVMHQYHLGTDEEEREGELAVSKVFYQTQPRQSSARNAAIREGSSAVCYGIGGEDPFLIGL